MTTFVNGEPLVLQPVAQRALNYGDGLFETMRYERGGVALLGWHLNRLAGGATVLGIDHNSANFEAELERFLSHLGSLEKHSGVIKLRLVRGGDRRGYATQEGSESWRIFEYFAGLPEWGKTETALICRHPLSAQPALAGIKHLNRLDQVMAAREISGTQCSTGLMLDLRGFFCCGIDSNLFVEKNNQIVTPKLDHSGVAGVFKNYMMEQLSVELGIPILEENLQPEDLGGSSGVWLSNAVKGLRPVVSILDSMAWQSPFSPLLTEFQKLARLSLQVTS